MENVLSEALLTELRELLAEMSMGAIEKNKRACATQECEPPFGGKEVCEFFGEDGSCCAPDMSELAAKLSALASRRQ